jgi:hypothetical protein
MNNTIKRKFYLDLLCKIRKILLIYIFFLFFFYKKKKKKKKLKIKKLFEKGFINGLMNY